MTLTNRGGARWADAKRRAAVIRAERARENGMYLERDDFTQDEWDFLIGLKREAVYHGTRTGVEAIGCAHLRNHQLGWSEWPGDFVDAASALDARGVVDWSPAGRNRLGGTVAFRLPACSVTFESVPASAPDPHDADGVPLEPPSELMAEVFGERAPDGIIAFALGVDYSWTTGPNADVIERVIDAARSVPIGPFESLSWVESQDDLGCSWRVQSDGGRVIMVEVEWSLSGEPSASVVEVSGGPEVFAERAPEEADAEAIAALVHRTITHAVYALPYLREEEYVVELAERGNSWQVTMDSGRGIEVVVQWPGGEDEEPFARVVQSWWPDPAQRWHDRLAHIVNTVEPEGTPSDDEDDDVAVARIRPQDVVSVESDGLTGTYSGEQVIALLVADKVEREESAEQAYTRVQLWGYSYSVASQSLAAVGCTDLDQLHALAASIRDGVIR